MGNNKEISMYPFASFIYIQFVSLIFNNSGYYENFSSFLISGKNVNLSHIKIL